MDNRRFPAVLFTFVFQRGYLDLTIRDAKLQNEFYFPSIYLNKILEISIAFLRDKILQNIFLVLF